MNIGQAKESIWQIGQKIEKIFFFDNLFQKKNFR